MSKSELKLYFHLKNTSYIFSHMSHVSVLGKSSYGIPFHRVDCCTACRRVPRKLPNLVARRLESVIEKVMSSASNVEKVEKRGKYLKTMVGSGKDSSCYTLSRYCPASPLNLPNFTCNDCSGRSWRRFKAAVFLLAEGKSAWMQGLELETVFQLKSRRRSYSIVS